MAGASTKAALPITTRGTTLRWAPTKSLQMAFSFSPPVLLLLLFQALFAASSISAFSTFTTTRISISSSNCDVDNIDKQYGSYLYRRRWQQFQLQQRQRHRKNNRHASASKLSITKLNMSPSSSADDEQQGTTLLDVSSYMFPTTPATDNDDDNETKDYVMQQTMIRVKNPIQSLDFYCKILGFRLIHFSEVRSICVVSGAGRGMCV